MAILQYFYCNFIAFICQVPEQKIHMNLPASFGFRNPDFTQIYNAVSGGIMAADSTLI
jgi:hypothetical protein